MKISSATVESSAIISECGRYRYQLARVWAAGPIVGWAMLNPSTANASDNDNTIEKIIRFSKAWGYGGLIVANLYAIRSTDKARVRRVLDPIGPENDRHILDAARRCDLTVCAWGADGGYLGRDAAVLRLLVEAGIQPHYLRLTKGGKPEHPLYLPGDLTPIPFVAPTSTTTTTGPRPSGEDE